MQQFKEWMFKKLAKDAKLNIDKYDMEQIKMGMGEELEHGKKDPKLNVTNSDPTKTLKIVIAHLKEDPKYYTKLKKVM